VSSEADRRRLQVQAKSLELLETDEEPTPSNLAAAIESANRFRRANGLPPLEEGRELPEEELYRRARALGLRRSRG